MLITTLFSSQVPNVLFIGVTVISGNVATPRAQLCDIPESKVLDTPYFSWNDECQHMPDAQMDKASLTIVPKDLTKQDSNNTLWLGAQVSQCWKVK